MSEKEAKIYEKGSGCKIVIHDNVDINLETLKDCYEVYNRTKNPNSDNPLYGHADIVGNTHRMTGCTMDESIKAATLSGQESADYDGLDAVIKHRHNGPISTFFSKLYNILYLIFHFLFHPFLTIKAVIFYPLFIKKDYSYILTKRDKYRRSFLLTIIPIISAALIFIFLANKVFHIFDYITNGEKLGIQGSFSFFCALLISVIIVGGIFHLFAEMITSIEEKGKIQDLLNDAKVVIQDNFLLPKKMYVSKNLMETYRFSGGKKYVQPGIFYYGNKALLKIHELLPKGPYFYVDTQEYDECLQHDAYHKDGYESDAMFVSKRVNLKF